MSRKTLICGLALALCAQVLLNGCESDGPTGGGGGSGFNDSLAFEIQIEKVLFSVQGTHEIVDVSLNSASHHLTGFELKVVFEADALAFQAATPGNLFTNCGWEYFDYRLSVIPPYHGGSPRGLIHLNAVADLNLGLPRMSEIACQNELKEGGPVVLFSLDFIVSEDPVHECRYLPIRFYWEDCDDNVVNFRPDRGFGEEVRSATNRIIDFDDITDEDRGFPTYKGYQRECSPNNQALGPPPIRMLDLLNGGVDLPCADGVGVWGDVNLDGEFNIADVVMFVDVIVLGVEVLTISREKQIAATDANGDGRTLTVSDLVYLVLVVIGDATPLPLPDGGEAECSITDGVASIDRDVVAATIVIEGDAEWTSLTERTSCSSRMEGGKTIVLILAENDKHSESLTRPTFTGPFLQTEGEIVSIDMSTVGGAWVDVTIVEE